MQKYISHNQCVCWYHDLFDMTCVTGYKCRFWTSLGLIQMTLCKILEWQKFILQNHQEPDTTSHSMHELHSSGTQSSVLCAVPYQNQSWDPPVQDSGIYSLWHFCMNLLTLAVASFISFISNGGAPQEPNAPLYSFMNAINYN